MMKTQGKRETFPPLSSKKRKYKAAGQISLFLGIITIVIISFLAFIINVGLFVKAKINLQNAVDAAAFSGAAVQARQLTNIAYLNWELRNTYKEWMFKYYVLGQKGLDKISTTGLNMNFRLRSFYPPGHVEFDPSAFDRFNVPSICIHYGSPHNICPFATVPGLPRFNNPGLPGIDEHKRSFINTLVKLKSADCSERSQVNMGAALLWAYGTGLESTQHSNIPKIAASRPGAWIEALELAIRIRNLEFIVNTPPVSQPICLNNLGENSCTSIQNITDRVTNLPHYERTAKAFYSAFRNLGGGANKKRGAQADPFISSFRLQELSPNAYLANPNGLSGFLIPNDQTDALQKHYLDLQVYPVNYITFFTLFTAQTGNLQNSATQTEGKCIATKTALPVPAYITGFTKNPEVLTYYAVKGEAEFVGLFYPFTKTKGINLKAYAAAKPMGGRIGPKLFKIEGNSIFPRQESEKNLSVNYASVLDPLGLNNITQIQEGTPLPTVPNFWANTSTNPAIGGSLSSGSGGQVYFTIPNLLYDFTDVTELDKSEFRDVPIQELSKAINHQEAYVHPAKEGAGLYDIEQFKLFKANQEVSSGPLLTTKDLYQSLYNVRRPTRYEALNYMIPTITEGDQNPAQVNHNFYFYHTHENEKDPRTGTKYYNLFGPMYGPHTLYPEVSFITKTVDDYIRANEHAINKYLSALKSVSEVMKVSSGQAVDDTAYEPAANTIYKDGPITDCDKPALNQTFQTFFLGNAQHCGILPLRHGVTKYFTEKGEKSRVYQYYYVAPYETRNSPLPLRSLMTGFAPGPRQGAGEQGEVQRPFGGDTPLYGKRNFYSTKLFSLQKVVTGGASKARTQHQRGFDLPAAFMEGTASFAAGSNSGRFVSSADFANIQIHNLINPGQIEEWRFLDF